MTENNIIRINPDTLISVIVSTYNRPAALSLVLQSLLHQSDNRFEVIIADDGSTTDTKELIDSLSSSAHFPIRHYWQPDKGFRLARSRNGAVNLSSGDYLIFVDGDCCMMPDFIRTHRKLMEKSWFVTGRRVYIKKHMTDRIFKHNLAYYRWPRSVLLLMGLLAQSNRPLQFIKFPEPLVSRKKYSRTWHKAQACNMAVWKDDFMNIDGFDEIYEGYGYEDSDFIVRLIRNGSNRKTAEFTSPVLHLYHRRHPPQELDSSNFSQEYFENLLKDESRYTAIKGISRYLTSANISAGRI